MENKTISLIKENIKNPPIEMRPVQIIHHYFPNDKESIDKYLDMAVKNEMGGFVINMDILSSKKEGEGDEEYRERCVNNYLSEGTPEADAKWQGVVQFADGCFERNLKLWFYDELAFPSGAAGRKVYDDNNDYQVKGLICATNTTEKGEKFVIKDSGRMLYSAAYAIENVMENEMEKEVLKTDRVILPCKEDGEKIYFDIPDDGKKYRMCAIFVRKAEFYTVNEMPYVDLMRKDVTDSFIKHTHEKYIKYLGEERMKKVTAFFTDEPSLPVHGCQSSFYEKNAITSWTEEMEGYVPNERLVDIFFDTDRDFAKIRVKWWSKIAELFSQNYFGRVGRWCEAHGTRMTGHLYGEETLSMQIGLNGTLFGVMRYMQAPGVDRLYCYDPRDITAEKTASSAMHFYNRDMSMSENSFCLEYSFWDKKEEATCENRLNSDYYQKQLGITNPASYFFIDDLNTESSSRKEYELKSGRTAYFNSVGKHKTDVLVLIPIKEAYSRFAPPDNKYWKVGPCTVAPFQGQSIQNLEKSYGEVLLKLEDNIYDLDLVDDIALCECKTAGGIISSYTENYNTLVIFDSDMYDEKTKETIKKFLTQGGYVTIVIADKQSEYTAELVKKYGNNVTLANSDNICEKMPAARKLVEIKTEEARDIRVKKTVTDDCDLYFIHNRSDKNKKIFLPFENFTVFESSGDYYEGKVSRGLILKRKEILMCAIPKQ